jgi:hypothetical protein
VQTDTAPAERPTWWIDTPHQADHYHPEQLSADASPRYRAAHLIAQATNYTYAERHSGLSQRPEEAPRPPHERVQVEQWTTSLDPKETSGFGCGFVSCPQATAPQQAAALTLWTYAAPGTFDQEGRYTPSDQEQIAQEVGDCGSQIWVALDDTGPCTIRSRCKHRQCPACRNYRGKQIADAITTMTSDWKHVKFLTLTRKPRDGSLHDIHKSLLHDFNRLRRTALWKACASRGVYTVEITRHPQRTHWHVHLHCLLESKYIPQAALSDAWRHITGDSQIVHIRAAAPSDSKYLAKYVSKCGGVSLEPWEEWAFHNELSGSRLCGTFGGAPSIESCQPEPNHTLIAPLSTVQQWAMNGDVWAQQLLADIAMRMLPTEKPTESARGAPP